MTLIQKIKSYFRNYNFYTWKNVEWENYHLKFQSIDEETLLDIGNYIRHNLDEAQQIGNKRHRLVESQSIECKSLDELLPLIRTIITSDHKETSAESIRYNWNFQYFVSEHALCANTICISNGISSNDAARGNCIYPIATVRKYRNSYFCWNNLV